MSRNAFSDIEKLIVEMPEISRAHVKEGAYSALSAVSIIDEPSLAAVNWFQSCSAAHITYPQRPTLALYVATYGEDREVIKRAEDYVRLTTKSGGLSSYAATKTGCGLSLFELAPQYPFVPREGALGEEGAAATIAYGMEATSLGADLLIVGASSDGISAYESLLCEELNAIEVGDRKAIEAFLMTFAGRDIAALLGAIAAARYQQIPVMVEGLSAHIAACLLYKYKPSSIDHVVSARKDVFDIPFAIEVFAASDYRSAPGVDGTLAAQVLSSRIQLMCDLKGLLDAPEA